MERVLHSTEMMNQCMCAYVELTQSNEMAMGWFGLVLIRCRMGSKMSPKMLVKTRDVQVWRRVEETAGGGVVLGRKLKWESPARGADDGRGGS